MIKYLMPIIWKPNIKLHDIQTSTEMGPKQMLWKVTYLLDYVSRQSC